MYRLVSTSVRVATIALLGLAVASCGPTRLPQYLSADLAEDKIDVTSISLMPVIDLREDQFDNVNIASQARSASKRLLAARGYVVVPDTAATPDRPLSSGELAAMSDAELAELGEAHSPVLLYVYVEKLDREFTDAGEQSRVTVSGVLIDRQTKQPLWRDKAVGQSNMTGLFTVLTGPSTEYEAVYQALRYLFSTIPKRKA